MLAAPGAGKGLHSQRLSASTRVALSHRLRVFEEQTKPVVEYYRHRGLLAEFDADRPPTTSKRTSADNSRWRCREHQRRPQPRSHRAHPYRPTGTSGCRLAVGVAFVAGG